MNKNCNHYCECGCGRSWCDCIPQIEPINLEVLKKIHNYGSFSLHRTQDSMEYLGQKLNEIIERLNNL